MKQLIILKNNKQLEINGVKFLVQNYLLISKIVISNLKQKKRLKHKHQ